MPNNKYCLWLRPTQNQIDKYGQIISQLAHQYKSLSFPAHITLVSGLTGDLNSLKQSCQNIVDSTSKFDISCNTISYTDEFYKNFFVLADLSNNLIQLYETTIQKLNFNSEEEYIPHVSLYYGNLNLETQKKLAEELEDDYPKVFNLERLDIYEHSGTIMQWYLVESFYFK